MKNTLGRPQVVSAEVFEALCASNMLDLNRGSISAVDGDVVLKHDALDGLDLSYLRFNGNLTLSCAVWGDLSLRGTLINGQLVLTNLKVEGKVDRTGLIADDGVLVLRKVDVRDGFKCDILPPINA
jgi:hypothetical protein